MSDYRMSETTYQIAQLSDVENVFNYECNKHFNMQVSQTASDVSTEIGQQIEKQIMVWNSFFRKEALEHYFKTGWSFLALDSQQNIVGFFMGQALLFLDKQTQSLWVEYISGATPQIYTELVEIAYRLSREKHFQKVLFSEVVQQQPLTKQFSFTDWERKVSYLKTTRTK